MAKRGATSELNHENWNEEMKAEDAGTFRTAAPAELSARKILKPKRKLPESNSPVNPFQSFGGFADVPTLSTPASLLPTVQSVENISVNSASVTESDEKNKNGVGNKNGNVNMSEIQTSESNSQKESNIDKDNNEEALQGENVSNNNSTLLNSTSTSDSGPIENQLATDSVDNSEGVSTSEVAGKGISDELDLPDFVDQSDDEVEERAEEKDQPPDSENSESQD